MGMIQSITIHHLIISWPPKHQQLFGQETGLMTPELPLPLLPEANTEHRPQRLQKGHFHKPLIVLLSQIAWCRTQKLDSCPLKIHCFQLSCSLFLQKTRRKPPKRWPLSLGFMVKSPHWNHHRVPAPKKLQHPRVPFPAIHHGIGWRQNWPEISILDGETQWFPVSIFPSTNPVVHNSHHELLVTQKCPRQKHKRMLSRLSFSMTISLKHLWRR